jgi:hypothetical protein
MKIERGRQLSAGDLTNSGTGPKPDGGYIGAAIRRAYPPDAACDERLDGLLEQLKSIGTPKKDLGDVGSGGAAQSQARDNKETRQ